MAGTAEAMAASQAQVNAVRQAIWKVDESRLGVM